MEIKTWEDARNYVNKWLTDNQHDVKIMEDDAASFHFEVDYPVGTQKKQRIIQPKEYPDMILILTGVSVADEHKEKLKRLSEARREKFYAGIKKSLMFIESSYDMNLDDEGVVQQIQFSYEFYFDALTKTNLLRALLQNYRTLLYFVTVFNDEFGVPTIDAKPPEPGQQQNN